MKATVIAIGDELLIGQVIDTNSSYIAKALNAIGWELHSTMAVHDSKKDIVDAINTAYINADAVITTGGLGPTKDDITKYTLCEYFGGKMVYDEAWESHLNSLFTSRGIKMNKNTHDQGYVPDNCEVLPNPDGTAPIMWWDINNKILVSLPGVPSEMMEAIDNEIIPRLVKRFPNTDAVLHHSLLVTNYTESALAIHLEKFEEQMPDFIHLAYLPTPGLIRLRLTAIHNNKKEAETVLNTQVALLESLLGDDVISHHDASLSQLLGEILKEKNMTVSTAESCTGGAIASAITKISGASDYYYGSVVSYSNEVKKNVLNVDGETLSKYGAVSEQVVKQMTAGVCNVMSTDCAIATSGIAGPTGGTSDKPVGTVWISVRIADRSVEKCCHFKGNREKIIERASHMGILMLVKMLKGVLK